MEPQTRTPILVSPLLRGPLGWFGAASFVTMVGFAAAGNSMLLAVDRPASEFIRGDAFAGFFRIITTLGATEFAIGTALVAVPVLWRRCRSLAALYPATLAVGAVLNIALKAAIGRPRPPSPGTGVALASFPSGHTLQATLLFGFLPLVVSLVFRQQWARHLGVVVGVAGVFVVGLSRVYLGAHWPTDVFAGVIVGLALVVGAEKILGHRHGAGRCRCALASM